ncbi:MAG: HAD family hydrolase [Nocardioides sp.]
MIPTTEHQSPTAPDLWPTADYAGQTASDQAGPGQRWAAVLWDLDGTLIDTEPYWAAAEFRLARDCGSTWSTQQAQHVVGWDLLDSAHYLRDQMRVDLAPTEIVDRLVADVRQRLEDQVVWRPGALDMLGSMYSAGMPLALVTMSYRELVTPVLAHLPAGLFAVVVTGDAVVRGKPHPDAYLQAAEQLGLAADACLALEDSDTGARAAEAAGCQVLVVPHEAPVVPTPRRVFVPSLAGLDPHRVMARFA